mmetsp:Transcript_11826/g.46170  ORF Transcript_11826/g.46170 Transcript_11826/m.46170 type:complete len:295 (+) Transcript_11826:997-1881(+)
MSRVPRSSSGTERSWWRRRVTRSASASTSTAPNACQASPNAHSAAPPDRRQPGDSIGSACCPRPGPAPIPAARAPSIGKRDHPSGAARASDGPKPALARATSSPPSLREPPRRRRASKHSRPADHTPHNTSTPMQPTTSPSGSPHSGRIDTARSSSRHSSTPRHMDGASVRAADTRSRHASRPSGRASGPTSPPKRPASAELHRAHSQHQQQLRTHAHRPATSGAGITASTSAKHPASTTHTPTPSSDMVTRLPQHVPWAQSTPSPPEHSWGDHGESPAAGRPATTAVTRGSGG